MVQGSPNVAQLVQGLADSGGGATLSEPFSVASLIGSSPQLVREAICRSSSLTRRSSHSTFICKTSKETHTFG